MISYDRIDYKAEAEELRKANEWLRLELNRTKLALNYFSRREEKKRIMKLQFKIDSLMFEFCPNEMTKEQISRFEQSQSNLVDESNK